MHRLSILILMFAAAVTGTFARTLVPPRPGEYVPLLSELMLSRLSDDKTFVSNEEMTIDLGDLVKQYRFRNSEKPFASNYCVYAIDLVTPDLIDIRMSEDGEAVKNKLQVEEMQRKQLAALPGNRKRPLAILVSTLYPGGIPDSKVRFLEYLPEKEMLRENRTKTEWMKSFTAGFNNYLISSDSVKSELHRYAADAGLLPTDTVMVREESLPEYTSPKDLEVSRFLKTPSVSDFFNIPKGEAGKQVKEAITAIPFPMISYEISPSDFSLTATLHYTPLVSMELAEELEPYSKKELVYHWNGKQYKLAQPK